MTSMGYMQEQDVIIEGLNARIEQLEARNKKVESDNLVMRAALKVIGNTSPSETSVRQLQAFARDKIEGVWE